MCEFGILTQRKKLFAEADSRRGPMRLHIDAPFIEPRPSSTTAILRIAVSLGYFSGNLRLDNPCPRLLLVQAADAVQIGLDVESLLNQMCGLRSA